MSTENTVKMEPEQSSAHAEGEFSMVNRYAIKDTFRVQLTEDYHLTRAVPQRGSRELKVEDALLYLDQAPIDI